MPSEDAQQKLSDAILSEAQKRAESALNAAREEAERLRAAAAAAAAAESEQILRDGAERARKQTQMILRAVEQDAARRRLRAREEVLGEAFALAVEQMRRVEGEAYRRSVVRLALDGLRNMPGDEFLLAASGLSEAEGASVADEVAAALRGAGRSARVRFQPASAQARGVVVASADGRVQWDNTYPARLERMKEELRLRAAEVLFQESSSAS